MLAASTAESGGRTVSEEVVPRVLVVDDDADVRESVREILEEAGYAVDEAGDGAEALEQLERGPVPSLVLLDIMMPRMDGIEFRRRQLADPGIAAIPVVVMTANYERAMAAPSLRGTDVLAKPMQLPQLLDKVARYCERD